MIRTSTQLKAKIRNLSGGDNEKAKVLIRNFVMERFLERVALSQYRNNFILKGGMLVAAVVGLETRATMDIDTSVKSLSLTIENAQKVVEDSPVLSLEQFAQSKNLLMIQPTLSSENVLFHARHDHTKAYVPSQTEAREERESGRLRMQALLRFKRKGSFFASSRIPPFEQRIPGKPFGCGRNR